MKKSLLATTAIAALGAVVVAAPASAKFEVGVSGYMEQWFGYSDNKESVNADSDVFDQISDNEFNIDFKQTLDNGLVVGGQIQVEGGQGPFGGSGELIDEQYLYLQGSFGRIEMGTDNGAAYRMHYGIASKGIGIDEGDVANWVAGVNGNLRRTNQGVAIENDQNKLTYFSPRINGFQFGASYMPSSEDINDDNPGADPGQEADTERDNAWTVAANYTGSFDALSLKASLTYTDAGDDGAIVGDETAMSAGIQLGFGGFTASFAYGEHERDDDPAGAAVPQDVNIFGFGLAYSAGPAGVSVAYIRGEDSENNLNQDALELGASYAIGPGVTAKGSVYYAAGEDTGADVANGIGVAAGLALSF